MALPLPTRSNGQTIDQTWFNDINTELVSLDAKLTNVVDDGALVVSYKGELDNMGSYERAFHTFLTQDIDILSATLYIETNGSGSGSLEIDVKFKRGAGAWTSIFTTKPKIPYSAGNAADSDTGTGATAAVINSTYDNLLAGDQIRLDITEVPAGTPENFTLKLFAQNTGAY